MVFSVPQVDLHQSIVIVPSNNVQSATIILLHLQAIGSWKWTSFIVSSPSWFMSPGFTPTHALVLLDLLLDLRSYLTFHLCYSHVPGLYFCSDDHFPFPLSDSTFRFLCLQLPLLSAPLSLALVPCFSGWLSTSGIPYACAGIDNHVTYIGGARP